MSKRSAPPTDRAESAKHPRVVKDDVHDTTTPGRRTARRKTEPKSAPIVESSPSDNPSLVSVRDGGRELDRRTLSALGEPEAVRKDPIVSLSPRDPFIWADSSFCGTDTPYSLYGMRSASMDRVQLATGTSRLRRTGMFTLTTLGFTRIVSRAARCAARWVSSVSSGRRMPVRTTRERIAM